MKRILILVALGLFLCSTASTFQDGGGKPTKTPTPTPKPKAPSPPKPKVEPHKRSSTPTPSVEVTTPSGLKYIDEVVGTGESPQTGQNVTAHYTGTLENGTKFDSSVDRGQPFTFRIGTASVIKGWDEGVMTMKVGGKRRLIVPPNLGYGTAGSPPKIPPNAKLIFEVELLSVSVDNTTPTRPAAPTAPSPAPAAQLAPAVERECDTPCTMYVGWGETIETGGRPVSVLFNGKKEWFLLPGNGYVKIPLEKFASGAAQFASPNGTPVRVQIIPVR